MPFAASYTLLTAPTAPAPLTPGEAVPYYTSWTPLADVVYHDSTYFLGVLNASFPADYVAGLKQSQSSGYTHFEACAAVGERVSAAISNSEVDSFVITARGGAKATGTVEVWKTSTQAFTLKAGCLLATDDQRLFATTADVLFDGTNNGPFSVGIEAIAIGYAYNVAGQTIAKNGDVAPGAIVNVERWITSPATYESTLQFRQVLPTTGGEDDALSLLGHDLGIERVPFEDTEFYRFRIKEAPDTVCRGAIVRALTRFVRGLNQTYNVVVREIGTELFPGMFYDAGTSSDSPQSPSKNFAYDMDPVLAPSCAYKLVVDNYMRRGFFLVEVPNLTRAHSFGGFYDIPAGLAPATYSAYDTTGPAVRNSAYDGKTLYDTSQYVAIQRIIRDKVAAGVGFLVYTGA